MFRLRKSEQRFPNKLNMYDFLQISISYMLYKLVKKSIRVFARDLLQNVLFFCSWKYFERQHKLSKMRFAIDEFRLNTENNLAVH